MPQRRFLCSFLVTLAIALAAAADLAAEQPGAGLYLSGRMGPGNHSSDLEPRYYDDKFFGALLAGGVGYNTPWEGNSGLDIDWGVVYRTTGHWVFQYESSGLHTQPSYSGFYSINASGFSAGSFENVSIEPLYRDVRQFLGGKNVLINPDWNVDLMAGIRSQGEAATYSITRINQFTAPFNLTQLEVSTDTTTLGTAGGITFGALFRTTVSKDLEISGGMMIYDLNGTAKLDYQTIKASSVGGAVALRHEDGLWRVTGVDMQIGFSYVIAPTWRLVGTFHRENATVSDSNVINYNFSSDSTFSASNSILGFLLTYPGSAKQDGVARLEVGVEKRFDL